MKKELGAFVLGDSTKCTGCKACENVCPQNCIEFTNVPAVINQKHCLHCGKCLEICPQHCIEWNGKKARIQPEHCLHCGLCFERCPQQAVVRTDESE